MALFFFNIPYGLDGWNASIYIFCNLKSMTNNMGQCSREDKHFHMDTRVF
jgi:hypothetical protein